LALGSHCRSKVIARFNDDLAAAGIRVMVAAVKQSPTAKHISLYGPKGGVHEGRFAFVR
jgi:hypothetical protein